MIMLKARVIFKSTDQWFQCFLMNGFGHVAVELQSEEGSILIDSNDCNTFVYQYKKKMQESSAFLNNSTTVNTFVNTTQVKKWIPSFFTCVTIVKSVLGIDERWIVTPYQLYKYLEKENGHTQSTRKNERRDQCRAGAETGA